LLTVVLLLGNGTAGLQELQGYAAAVMIFMIVTLLLGVASRDRQAVSQRSSV
jgi:hypothetical protein